MYRIVTAQREGRIIYLYCRDENLNKVILRVTDFYPYFYYPSTNGRYIAYDGTRVEKMICNDPSEVREKRENYDRVFEADIPYTRRFFIDRLGTIDSKIRPVTYINEEIKPIYPENVIPYRIWHLDIEVYSDTFVNEGNPDKPIVLITIYDSYRDKYYTFGWHPLYYGKEVEPSSNNHYIKLFKTEKAMLSLVGKLIEKWMPDIITGWNIYFDLDYLKARAKRLGISINIRGCEVLDLIDAYSDLTGKQLYQKLKDVVKELFGEKPLDISGEIVKYFDGSFEDFKTLIHYNYKDVEYTKRIDEKLGILNYFIQLRDVAGYVHLDEHRSSIIVDTMQLRVAKHKLGIVLPSELSEKSKPYRGADVFPVPKGVVEDVWVCDMASYYPNIIVTFGISPDRDRVLYPEMCKYLLNLKELVKKELKSLEPGTKDYELTYKKYMAVKAIINSIYGYLGSAYSRFRDGWKLAEQITAIAREGLHKLKEVAEEKYGVRVVGGDTDSIFIHYKFDLNGIQKLVDSLNSDILDYFTSKYDTRELTLKLEVDKYYKRVLFTGKKKRRIAWVKWEGKPVDYIEVKGFEVIRRDQADITKKVQLEVANMILKGKPIEKVKEYIKDTVRKFKTARFEEIGINTSLSKSTDLYKANTPTVRAVLWSNKYLSKNFKPGSRFKILYVKYVPGYPPTDVIAFEEDDDIPPGTIVDYNRMIDVCIKKKVEPLLDVIGLKWTDIFYHSLSGFLKM